MASSQQTRRSGRLRLLRWLGLALLIHAEAALVVGLAAYFWVPRDIDLVALAGGGKGSPESIEISTLDDAEARKIIAELEKEEEKAKEEQLKKEEEAPDAPGQVVDLAKPREEKRPESARFAAEHDSSVEKETKKFGKFDQRSRAGDVQGDAAQTRPAMPAVPPSQQTGPGKPGALAMRAPGPPAPRQGPPGPPGEPSPPVPNRPGEAFESQAEQGGELSPMALGAPARPPGGVNGGGAPAQRQAGGQQALLPSEQQLARAIGSGTQDHLKDIDDGDETALNAKKWKFASFFNRVKQQVRDHWRPAEEYRRRDPSGAIYGQKDRYTLLRVKLKADGTLAEVALELPSGIEFLDDEAIEAFKQAQPFPNPPKQLVDGDSGLINFRFGFFFELSGSPRFKIFRYNSM